MIHTQRIGQLFQERTVVKLLRMQRMLTFGLIALRLMPLQKRVIRHLWRPNGPMFKRGVPLDMITSTRDGGQSEVARGAGRMPAGVREKEGHEVTEAERPSVLA